MRGSDPCQTCPALPDCKEAVRARLPIACEDHPRPRYAKPRLTPGQLFTTADLMALTGQTLDAAGEWCKYHRNKGDIQLVAVNNHNQKVYRYTRT